MFKNGNEIQAGDELAVGPHNRPAVVKSIRPYTGPLLDVLGAGTAIASFIGMERVEMTLPAIQLFQVA
ncbi:hypothetical protein [Cupriavidus sp. CuC1]|uniref:hypothetical protein n=1 Tax=Cupriavidus sp. CuC1 TaxID=3373131 RepID=UPI0037CF6127